MNEHESAAAEFERRFRPLFRQAYKVGFRILGNPVDAEDAAAETLARVLASWGRLRGKPYLEAWVSRVASNAALDIRRRHRRHGTQADEISVEVPEAPILATMVARDLLAHLPRRQKEVLVLRYFGDFTEDEVARCLGISLGAVKTHGHRGLARLRQLLQDQGGGPE
ncbi:MAG: RNA polymerase sigma factor [Mycobacteriales bacterium]